MKLNLGFNLPTKPTIFVFTLTFLLVSAYIGYGVAIMLYSQRNRFKVFSKIFMRVCPFLLLLFYNFIVNEKKIIIIKPKCYNLRCIIGFGDFYFAHLQFQFFWINDGNGTGHKDFCLIPATNHVVLFVYSENSPKFLLIGKKGV